MGRRSFEDLSNINLLKKDFLYQNVDSYNVSFRMQLDKELDNIIIYLKLNYVIDIVKVVLAIVKKHNCSIITFNAIV